MEHGTKVAMQHLGRHPDAYHKYMLDKLRGIDKLANGNQQIF